LISYGWRLVLLDEYKEYLQYLADFNVLFLLFNLPYDLEPETAATTPSATVSAVLKAPTHAPSPSPSLTSLLHPPSLLNRSTISARSPTPNSSNAETPNDTEAAVAHSARRATVVERIAHKSPHLRELRLRALSCLKPRFPCVASSLVQPIIHLILTVLLVLCLLWSYLPSPFLHAISLHHYPNRW
jgi:phosphatidylinositol glycan class P protein